MADDKQLVAEITVTDIEPYDGDERCQEFYRSIDAHCSHNAEWVVHHEEVADLYLCDEHCNGVDEYN